MCGVFIRQWRFVVLKFTIPPLPSRHDEQRENHIITITGRSAVPTETDYRRGGGVSGVEIKVYYCHISVVDFFEVPYTSDTPDTLIPQPILSVQVQSIIIDTANLRHARCGPLRVGARCVLIFLIATSGYNSAAG